MDEPIHIDRACGGEIPATDAAVARQPIRTVIVHTSAGELEGRKGCFFIVLVTERGQLVVDAIDVIGDVVITDVIAIRFPVGIQHPKVIVERMVLLQHEDDVFDGLSAPCPCRSHRHRRGGGGVFPGPGRGCGVSRRRGRTHCLRSAANCQRIRAAIGPGHGHLGGIRRNHRQGG